ncbi:MAG: IclR family transcriptional regulator domain-containing protein, partial [Ilumatobacteraceae bacterium]
MPEPVQSVVRALRLLETFDARHPTRTAAEITDLVGLPRPTTYRLLHTLEVLGYLRRRDGRYEPTARILTLASTQLGAGSLAASAQPIIDAIAAELQEAIVVGVLDGDDVVTIAAAMPATGHYLSVAIEIGRRLPAEATALGQVLLAAATNGTERRNLDLVVADDGHVISEGLLEDGLRAIAVPVADTDGTVVAAVSLAVNAARVSADELRVRCPRSTSVGGRSQADRVI